VRPPSREGPRIFISYRREDTAGYADRLYNALTERFGAERVSWDIDTTIQHGESFSQALETRFESVDVVIALIGKNWLTAADHGLDDPNDLVRSDIATALRKDVRVIPALVQGAAMPSPDALPEPLKPITRRQAVDLSDLSWDNDVNRLLRHWEPPPPPAPAPSRNPFRRWAETRGQRKADEDEVSSVERDVE
jgi:TIR domain